MIYTSLFIRRYFNAYVSLYSRVSLILLNRVAWLVLLFGFFSLSNGNGFDLSVRVKISTCLTQNSSSDPHFSQASDLSSFMGNQDVDLI